MLERALAAGAAGVAVYLRLAAARRAIGDVAGALDPVAAAIRLEPRHFPAWLMGGSLLRALGRSSEAARAYQTALEVAPPPDSLPPPFRQELDLARQHVQHEQTWREAASAMPLKASSGELDADERRRLEHLRDAIAAGRRSAEGVEFDYPGLVSAGFFDPTRFEGVADLEAATAAIIAEYRTVARVNAAARVSMAAHTGDVTADDTTSGSRQWSAVPLIAEGEVIEANAALCPESMRLYEALRPPRIAGRSPNLMFSVLDPRTRIPPHRGVANTRLVLHLPLIIPPDCAIRVGDETRAWEMGRALVFDDTLEHEAWNDSDALRVVLLGDIWRPELNVREREVIAALMAKPA